MADIFAAENRQVATVEGATLHGIMKNEVYMLIHSQVVYYVMDMQMYMMVI